MRLIAEQVSVTRGQKILLHSLTVGIEGGDMLGIIGPNGAGKSTLLKILAGLIKPTTGFVRYEGQALEDFSPFERGRNLAYLPQESLLPYGLKLRDIVALGRLPHQRSLHLAEEKAILARVLAETSLSRQADSLVEHLSGGERARVLLARALAVEAPVLLVDEPVVTLDPSHALLVMKLLREEAVRWHGAVAVVLHDLALAARFCTRLILLDQGCVLAEGTPFDVMAPDLLAQAYGVHVRMVEGIPVPWERF